MNMSTFWTHLVRFKELKSFFILFFFFSISHRGHNTAPHSTSLSLEQSECPPARFSVAEVRCHNCWSCPVIHASNICVSGTQGGCLSPTRPMTTSTSTRSSTLWLCCDTTASTHTYVESLVGCTMLSQQSVQSGLRKQNVLMKSSIVLFCFFNLMDKEQKKNYCCSRFTSFFTSCFNFKITYAFIAFEQALLVF